VTFESKGFGNNVWAEGIGRKLHSGELSAECCSSPWTVCAGGHLCECDSNSVRGSRNKLRAERLALVKSDFAVCIYRRLNGSHSTLFVFGG
jgi:hypothetical protein